MTFARDRTKGKSRRGNLKRDLSNAAYIIIKTKKRNWRERGRGLRMEITRLGARNAARFHTSGPGEGLHGLDSHSGVSVASVVNVHECRPRVLTVHTRIPGSLSFTPLSPAVFLAILVRDRACTPRQNFLPLHHSVGQQHSEDGGKIGPRVEPGQQRGGGGGGGRPIPSTFGIRFDHRPRRKFPLLSRSYREDRASRTTVPIFSVTPLTRVEHAYPFFFFFFAKKVPKVKNFYYFFNISLSFLFSSSREGKASRGRGESVATKKKKKKKKKNKSRSHHS